jgi:hypothetical protein
MSVEGDWLWQVKYKQSGEAHQSKVTAKGESRAKTKWTLFLIIAGRLKHAAKMQRILPHL